MLKLVLKQIFLERRQRITAHSAVPADVAVVLQTVLRPSLEQAVRSVFEQDLEGHIHLLIGVDKRVGDPRMLDALIKRCPSNVRVTSFDPGYSTSVRHGGIHTNHFGGSLRTLLTFAANSRYVAYLDDDDWYAKNHLSSLLTAIRGKAWAFSGRWFVNPYNLEPMCVDTIENLGPNAGVYAPYGGFACPSSLIIDKRACAPILHLWSEAGRAEGDAEDRVFFRALCTNFGANGSSGAATVYCVIKPEDGSHCLREQAIVQSGYPIERLQHSHRHGFGRV